jgi:hypothetical protein
MKHLKCLLVDITNSPICERIVARLFEYAVGCGEALDRRIKRDLSLVKEGVVARCNGECGQTRGNNALIK